MTSLLCSRFSSRQSLPVSPVSPASSSRFRLFSRLFAFHRTAKLRPGAANLPIRAAIAALHPASAVCHLRALIAHSTRPSFCCSPLASPSHLTSPRLPGALLASSASARPSPFSIDIDATSVSFIVKSSQLYNHSSAVRPSCRSLYSRLDFNYIRSLTRSRWSKSISVLLHRPVCLRRPPIHLLADRSIDLEPPLYTRFPRELLQRFHLHGLSSFACSPALAALRLRNWSQLL